MRDVRNVCWKLNWYRHSELEGALLMGKMARRAREPELVRRLTKHCADEARHAWLWERTLTALDLPIVCIYRSYQSFYFEETGPPRSLTEVLALTHIFEQRVHRQFTEDASCPGMPDAARRTLRVMLRDEKDHLDWVAGWLATRADAEALLERYRGADERVYRRLIPYRDRIWDIPGLGEVILPEERDEEERHASQFQHSA